MGRMCYLCRRKSSKSEQISLHSFPKRPALRQKWLHACDLSATDNLTCIFICSLHFADGEVEKGNPVAKFRLKHGAVPSKNVPNPFDIDIASSKDVPNQLDIDIVSSKDVPTVSVSRSVSSTVIQELLDVNYKLSPVENNIIISSIDSEKDASNSDKETYNEEGYTTSTKKRRCFEPRYVSEIILSDVATPRSAQRVLRLVRASDKKKSKQIKILQEENRKVQQRISILAETLAHLKQKDLVSTEVDD